MKRDLSVPRSLHRRTPTTIAAVGRRRPTGAGAIIVVAISIALLLSACGGESEQGAAQYEDRTDSPLLKFGEEGTTAELEEAGETVRGFFIARADEDFDGACAPLAKQILNRLERLAVNSTDLEDTSCAAFLDAFLELTPQERADSQIVDAGSLRRKGKQGYLIYSGEDDTVYAMPLKEEAGEWKLASLSSEELS